jgi:hypothetical protein
MLSLQDKLKRRANARSTRSGPVRQDTLSSRSAEEKTLFERPKSRLEFHGERNPDFGDAVPADQLPA